MSTSRKSKSKKGPSMLKQNPDQKEPAVCNEFRHQWDTSVERTPVQILSPQYRTSVQPPVAAAVEAPQLKSQLVQSTEPPALVREINVLQENGERRQLRVDGSGEQMKENEEDIEIESVGSQEAAAANGGPLVLDLQPRVGDRHSKVRSQKLSKSKRSTHSANASEDSVAVAEASSQNNGNNRDTAGIYDSSASDPSDMASNPCTAGTSTARLYRSLHSPATKALVAQTQLRFNELGAARFAVRPLPPGVRLFCRLVRNERHLSGLSAEYTLSVEEMGANGVRPSPNVWCAMRGVKTVTGVAESHVAESHAASDQCCSFLLAARRKSKCRHLTFLISCDPLNISKRFDTYVGKLKSLNYCSMYSLVYSIHPNLITVCVMYSQAVNFCCSTTA